MSAGGYLLLILMFAYLMLHLREFSLRTTEVFLFLFGAEYFLFSYLWFRGIGFRELCNYFVAPWLLYWMGRNMARRSRQGNVPLQITAALTLGFFTYGLLCIIYSMYFAPPTLGARVMYKFWDKSTLSVTAGGLLFSMALGTSIGQLTSKNTFRARVLWLAVLGVCIYYSLSWAHRTSFLILAILIVYNYLGYLLRMNTSPAKKAFLFCGSVFLISVIIFCLILDVGGCYTWLQSQWLYKRLTDQTAANSTDRFLIWKNFFEKWLLHPWGGKQFGITSAFVHNLWLDVYYLCGIIPFAALVAATGMIIRNVFRYRKIMIAQNDRRSVHILENCYLSVFLAFMVEPVLLAYPYVFLAMLLISGCVDGSIQKAQQPAL